MNRILSALCLLLALNFASASRLVFINLADTHSAYDNYPQLLTQVENVVSAQGEVPVYILFNGDLFEPGNVVAARSQGEVDWAFLRSLNELAPVILNLGNHEFDFANPSAFVAEAEGYGITVIGNIIDRTTQRLLAPAVTTIELDGLTVDVVGVATDQLNTYEVGARERILIPEPVSWIRHFERLTLLADFSVLMTHAGVVADRSLLVDLPDNVLFVVGGHDHLTLREEVSSTVYLHNGFRAEGFNVTTIDFAGERPELSFSDYLFDPATAAEPTLSAMVEGKRNEYLQAADLGVIGDLARDHTVREAAAWAVETLRTATGADVAMLNHSSFGSGLAAGPLPSYRFDEFLRFDNDVMRVSVEGEALLDMLALANQGETTPFEARTGDFVYATDLEPVPGQRYTLVTSSWVALSENAIRYLGRSDLEFAQLDGMTVKGLLVEALNP